MGQPLVRGLLWVVSASVLLLVGFVVVLFGMYEVGVLTGQISPERKREVQVLMTLYFRIVGLKGLLPQLLVGLALWPLVARFVPVARRGRSGLALGLAIAASASFAIVVPGLLAVDLPNWPALRMTGVYQLGMSWLLMTAGVVGAAFCGRIWLPDPEPAPATR